MALYGDKDEDGDGMLFLFGNYNKVEVIDIIVKRSLLFTN